MNPKYPVYIISKGRWESRLTSKTLEKIKVPYHIVIEEFEYDKYVLVIDSKKILILPQKYLDNYDTCDEFGSTKGKGSGAARNFVWDYSSNLGSKRHWLLDDNIRSFMRLNKNFKIRVSTGTIFRCAEDFCDRYTNIALAGFNYNYFAKRKDKLPPYLVNSRIYSCLLIDNSIDFRWRGRYNEDTDLSLRVLKARLCTIQFNAFLQEKASTQTMKGGNTEELYGEGTLPKSQMIVRLHPDVAKVVWKFNRWHHHVDYRPFKHNKLIKIKGVRIKKGVNNYGMVLSAVRNLNN